MTSVVMLRGTS